MDMAGVTFVETEGEKIPLVDLGMAGDPDTEEFARLSESLARVAVEYGYFMIKNPGIPDDFLAGAEETIRRFFELPKEAKMEIDISNSEHHRGYFPIGEENALGSEVKDLKEGFDMALELPEDDPDVAAGKPFHGPNVWPSAMPEMEPTLLRLYDEFRGTCERISSLFAVAWGVPADYFDSRTDKPLCQLRAVKYPPQEVTEVDDDDQIGCGTHTDYGVVTIIWQIDEPGLQMRTRDGRWVDVPRVPGTFACTLGDMTEIWTNGEWPATLHRVVNTTGRTRHSAAFFFDPNYDCVVAPLDSFVDDARPARYEPTTMGAHVHRGFDGTFSYRTDDERAEQSLG